MKKVNNKEEFDLYDFMSRDFYIVDCKDFIYFPRKVNVIEFKMAYNSPIIFKLNVTTCLNEPMEMYKEELERFKTFEEAKNYAKKLNEIPANKKKAEEWNNPKAKEELLLLQEQLRNEKIDY